MPELSRFFGIIIRMFAEAGGPHHMPHFHAYYQSEVGIFTLEPVELIAGSLPQKQRRLVEAWAELHRDELTAAWNRLQQGQSPLPIEPLRQESDAMMHPIFRVVSVSVIGSNTLRITFDDALERDIDFSPVLGGELFRPLRDPALFSQVRVDPEVHTIVWPNGADFDPATLHDWPVYCDALAAKAREWERAAA